MSSEGLKLGIAMTSFVVLRSRGSAEVLDEVRGAGVRTPALMT